MKGVVGVAHQRADNPTLPLLAWVRCANELDGGQACNNEMPINTPRTAALVIPRNFATVATVVRTSLDPRLGSPAIARAAMAITAIGTSVAPKKSIIV